MMTVIQLTGLVAVLLSMYTRTMKDTIIAM